jgi:hypothetical protein
MVASLRGTNSYRISHKKGKITEGTHVLGGKFEYLDGLKTKKS